MKEDKRTNIIKKKKRGFGFKIFIAFIVLICFLLAIAGAIIIYYLVTVPDLEELSPSPIAETSKVYAIDGSLLTEFHATENREIIPF